MASSVPVTAESSGDYDFAVEARSQWALARQRFGRHRLAVASLVLLTLDAHRWSQPVRAADDSANGPALWEDARIYAYGDVIGFGGYTALAAANGVAHPFWIATGTGDDHEVFTARLASRG